MAQPCRVREGPGGCAAGDPTGCFCAYQENCASHGLLTEFGITVAACMHPASSASPSSWSRLPPLSSSCAASGSASRAMHCASTTGPTGRIGLRCALVRALPVPADVPGTHASAGVAAGCLQPSLPAGMLSCAGNAPYLEGAYHHTHFAPPLLPQSMSTAMQAGSGTEPTATRTGSLMNGWATPAQTWYQLSHRS